MAGFTCSHFGRLYLQKRYLNQYIRSGHMNQTTSSCNKCGKSFTRSTGLKKHRRTCTGAPAVVVLTVADQAANKRCSCKITV